MASTAIDSLIFRDIFSTPAMRRVFSDESRIQRYLDIEAGPGPRASPAGNYPAAKPLMKSPSKRASRNSTWPSSRPAPKQSAIPCYPWSNS